MVQVKLITRKDKVFLKMCLAMEKPVIQKHCDNY